MFCFLLWLRQLLMLKHLKFGHIDLQALIQVMPERATAETQFNNFQSEMEDVLAEMQNELPAKIDKNWNSWEKMHQKLKEMRKLTEIQDMQQRIQNYQVTAQQQLQQKQSELLQPVFDKAEAAIGEVAKEQGINLCF